MALPTAPIMNWTNLRRVLTGGSHSPTEAANWLTAYLERLVWVAQQDQQIWADFLPPYFLWENPGGPTLPSKMVIGLVAPVSFTIAEDGLRAMVAAWNRCLLFSLPILDEPSLVNLVNQFLEAPVAPRQALELWREALSRTSTLSVGKD